VTPAQQYLKEIERLREEATQSARPWALHCALEDSQRAVGRVIRAAAICDRLGPAFDECSREAREELREALNDLPVEVDDV